MPAAEALRAVVLDASVAVRWVIEEDGSAEAVILLNQEIGWIAPRLLLTEVASALRRKVADGAMDAALAGQALDTLLQAVADGIVHLADDERIVSQALLLAISLEHKMPDCMYLALAEREGAAIATADLKLARLARGRNVDVLLVPHG